LDNYFLIAEIAKLHDKNGFVQIKSFSDFPERFFDLHSVFIEVFGDKRKFIVEDVQKINSSFILRFKNFNDDSVDFLIGKKIFVLEEDAINPDENTYFIHDLEGSNVFFKNEFFGKLIEVLQYPANDVYIIKDKNENEILIPALKDVIKSFDAIEKRLDIKDNYEFYEDEN